MRLLKQASTAQALIFLMVDSADHVTGKTGLTPVVTLSKNGAAFGAAAGAVTEISSGWYKVAGHATDTGTLGPLALHAAVAGADPTDVEYTVVAFDPQVATNLGLSALPTAAAGASGGLPLGDASGRVDLGKWLGSAPNALQSGRVDTYLGAVADGVLTAAKFAAGAFDAVWTVASRILTAGTNIVLAKGTGVTGFNDLDAPGVRGAVGLASASLDTQLAGVPAAVTASMDATSTGLAAIYSRAGLILANTDVATSTRLASAGYTVPPTAAAIRAEMDANSADLNSILAAIAALNNLSAAGAQTAAGAALDSRGFTAGRGPLLDALDAAISSRAATGAAMALTPGERITLRDAFWKTADYLEAGQTPFDALRYVAAAILGVYVPGTTSTFAAMGNPATARISAETPVGGGRTTVTLV